MVLLGVKIGDTDTNVCLVDGTQVFYHRCERHHQIKHLGNRDVFFWIHVIEGWGYMVDSIDAIAVVIDPDLVSFDFKPLALFEDITDDSVNPFTAIIKCPVYRVDHHYAHLLSAWPLCDPSSAVGIIIDGDGDLGRTYTVFQNGVLVDTLTSEHTQSFGIVLEHLAVQNGVEGHWLDLAGKAMGLKAYGTVQHQFLDLMSEKTLIDIKDVAFNTDWYEAVTGNNNPLDMLATVHRFAETTFPDFFRRYTKKHDTVVFAGGVAHNTVINGILRNHFPNIVIPPHCGDEGVSLGCVEFLRAKYNLPQLKAPQFPFITDDAILERPSNTTVARVAQLLADGKTVGWCQGASEIGQRALGHRSILSRCDAHEYYHNVNAIKQRETYRPYGCSVLSDRMADVVTQVFDSPHMMFVTNMKNVSSFPAVTHIDGTTRVQTVDSSMGVFYNLLTEFDKITNQPVVLNTSLNIAGKPIAATRADVLNIFNTSPIDVVCIGDEVFIK